MTKTLQIELPDGLFDVLQGLAADIGVPLEQLVAEMLDIVADASRGPLPGMSVPPDVLRVPRRKKQIAGSDTTGGEGAPSAGSKAKVVYQLKVTLKWSKPPIWRRILVSGDISLARLHLILQVAFGWSNSHLHQFVVGDVYYGEPDLDQFSFLGPQTLNERKARLKQVAPSAGSKFVYVYDFGDGWEHEVLVEKIVPPEPGVHYPICIKGKRACPPDDIGGIWGYAHFLEAIKDPEHPDHEDMLDWVDDGFDPEAFDLDAVNETLSKFR